MSVSTGVATFDPAAANAAATDRGTTAAVPAGSPVTEATAGTLEITAPAGAGTAADQATASAQTASASETDASAASTGETETSTTTSETAKKDAKRNAASGKKKLSRAARQRLKASKAVAVAKSKIGAPYRYGATGPHAFDCSGFVQYAWRKAGVRIPRVTTAQYRRIKPKVSWKDLRPGDLLFFNGKGHVGMYVGKGKMIHSPSSGKRVRIDKLSAWRKASFSGAVRPGM
ncbi:MAG TPA: C40 family peptidase [Natronosporangium sp.]